MKRCILPLLLLAANLACTAQSWCLPGATWWFDYQEMTVGREGVVRLSYVGDTVIQGEVAHELEVYASGVFIFTGETFEGVSHIPVFTTSAGSSVSTWDGSQWRLLFDLSQPPGSGWTLTGEAFDDVEVLVLDTGRVNIQGEEVRYSAVDVVQANGISFVDTVFERIGFRKVFIEPWRSFMLEADMHDLRCYSDLAIAYSTLPAQEDCDYVTGVPDLFGAATGGALLVWPNPAQDVLHVQLPEAVRQAMVMVRDALGREVLQQAVRSNGSPMAMDIRALPPGLYKVEVLDGTAGRWLAKWIKE